MHWNKCMVHVTSNYTRFATSNPSPELPAVVKCPLQAHHEASDLKCTFPIPRSRQQNHWMGGWCSSKSSEWCWMFLLVCLVLILSYKSPDSPRIKPSSPRRPCIKPSSPRLYAWMLHFDMEPCGKYTFQAWQWNEPHHSMHSAACQWKPTHLKIKQYVNTHTIHGTGVFTIHLPQNQPFM